MIAFEPHQNSENWALFDARMNALTLRHAHTVPAILANAGENAATKFLEFFAARIRNLNTREAYARACAQFLAWSENHVSDIRAACRSVYQKTSAGGEGFLPRPAGGRRVRGRLDGQLLVQNIAVQRGFLDPPAAADLNGRNLSALYEIVDYHTPIEETMEALHDMVRAGKARYIGASAMFAWQFQKALYVAEKHGWTRFVSMQNHLNLIYREEEREMLPLCCDEKIGVIPYSPLASGRLSRDWSSESTLRSETDQIAKSKYDATAETDREVVERVAEIAQKYGVPRVHIALAWLLQKKPVTAPIIGATKITHLEDAVGALSVKLTQEEVGYLEEPDVPHPIVGYQ
jgi:diketogulonate reductase-like aldo/keto reductase